MLKAADHLLQLGEWCWFQRNISPAYACLQRLDSKIMDDKAVFFRRHLGLLGFMCHMDSKAELSLAVMEILSLLRLRQ